MNNYTLPNVGFYLKGCLNENFLFPCLHSYHSKVILYNASTYKSLHKQQNNGNAYTKIYGGRKLFFEEQYGLSIPAIFYV